MELPFLLGLLLLPLIVAALIIAVSSIRRRRHTRDHGTDEPVHRGQAATAAVQDAASPLPRTGSRVVGGRERRAKSEAGSEDR